MMTTNDALSAETELALVPGIRTPDGRVGSRADRHPCGDHHRRRARRIRHPLDVRGATDPGRLDRRSSRSAGPDPRGRGRDGPDRVRRAARRADARRAAGMGRPVEHWMLHDYRRTGMYLQAIRAAVRPGDAVLDITHEPWGAERSSWSSSLWFLPERIAVEPGSRLLVTYTRRVPGEPDGLTCSPEAERAQRRSRRSSRRSPRSSRLSPRRS